jgi:hypothetical protein
MYVLCDSEAELVLYCIVALCVCMVGMQKVLIQVESFILVS